jgi:hypothetical protein
LIDKTEIKRWTREESTRRGQDCLQVEISRGP